MSFQIILREGITGGFAGPVVKQVVDIKGDSTGASIMQSTLKANSKTDYHTLAGSASIDDLSYLLQLLKSQLSSLPTEQPVGSEDIYGQDISISFFTDNFQWSNGGPEGCSQGGKSSVKATSEDKEKFKELVSLLKGIGEQFAISVM
ncbi:hypothetical protein G6F57_008902 [Rhizopus arrhizus]|uniref:Uncharacterized protein n=1 Tax=Rhizopus oryzae TaxID=64495 RepID=A0A9P6X4S2_RHIOR|nr:hypothetical protein G6F23_004814 [Rhizopus arrhizus]KAG1414921.1 hypothetical protein G6F58_006722 [Rhizopus delemar]KAG0786014.1 hypothetical protein G6F21_008887 [Rhizopus arrhizus]KAG0800200.1 hypothetical protein G6F22_002466 [Rhizopus arrhizus]KAG0815408.1 hypothetical protein G6F20_004017 [Rhizopus arrhizus]